METRYNFLFKPTRFSPKAQCQLMFLLCLFMIGLNSKTIYIENIYIENKLVSLTNCSFANATHVNCSNNPEVVSIPTGIYTTVLELYLNNNEIKSIQENDFHSLELLQIICLRNNSIQDIHPNSFRNLYRLQSLNLEGNEIIDLDPSGLTFQHLVSLRNLYLQNSHILTVNKYTFLTMAASGNIVSINMDNNPVKCDCDTLALKNWVESLNEKTVQISLQCENDDQRRSYKEVEDSVFGSCNSSQNDVFSNGTECFLCANDSTNYKCTWKPPAVCNIATQICQKSVRWYAANKSMEITSMCQTYQNCLGTEANNAKTCVIEAGTIRDVACDFCCRGPTCLKNSIGGRTKDFDFYLIFQGSSSNGPLNLTQLTNVDIKEAILLHGKFIGGIYVTLYESTPIFENPYKVVLHLHLTTFTTNNKDYFKALLSQAIQKYIEDQKGVLNDQSVVSSYLEGMECEEADGLCPAHLSCLQSQGNITRCLCDDSSFYNQSGKICSPVTELQVKNSTILSSSPDTVVLAWIAETHGTGVEYTIQSSPSNRQVVVNFNSPTKVTVSGLSPATQYNFTLTSTLTRDFYTKNVSSLIYGGWTKAVHGNYCDPNATIGNTCAGQNIQCIMSPSLKHRCLCSSSYYFSVNSTCREMLELQVENLKALKSTTDTITLTWQADKHGTNVSYLIKQVSGERELMVSSNATWTGLNPGTQYSFNVTSILYADDLYPERSVNSPTIVVWTKAVHGNICNPTALPNGNTCAGTNIQCILSQTLGHRCLCSTNYYFSITNTCREVKELQVKNLTASASTTDTVTLTWLADKHGANVSYIIQPVPDNGHLVEGSLSVFGATWTGLEPETQYNFTVTAILYAGALYPERRVNVTITDVWTTEVYEDTTVTVFISYIRQNAVYESFMANSSSQGYMKEEERIITGVKSAISRAVNLISICVDKFIPTHNQEYKVVLKIEVTTWDTTTIQKVINDAIQKNTNDPDGFFFKEKLKSLEVYSNFTGSYQCPYSVTSLEKGVIEWDTSIVGWQNAPCPYHDPLDNATLNATRLCLEQNGTVEWGEVNDSLCADKEEQENPDINQIFDRNITAGNARAVSSLLKTYTNQFKNFTVEMMSKTVNLLELLTTEEMLAQPDVVTNVMECVNNLLNVNVKTLEESETETSASKRLLSVINSVSNKTPFTESHLKLVTSNLAVAVHKVNSSQTENIALVADTDSGSSQNDSQVNVDFFTDKSPLLEVKTSIVIPVKALFDSLSLAEKNQLERISFIVHRTDILFASIENAEVKGSPLTVTTKSSAIEKSDDRTNQSEGEAQFFITKINSQVISANVPGVKVQNLSDNITITFEHFNDNATNARCMFWDESKSDNKGGWSDRGCGLVKSLAGKTTCGCNHLTNFALLMDVYGDGGKLSELDRKILSIISYVGCGISFVALVLTLLIYSVFRTLRRDNPSKILINLCLALLCSNLIFLVGMQDYAFDNIASCKAVAVLLHYFLLASLCWMAVEAFYMYLALVLVFKTYFTNFIFKCSLVGWGVPLVIIIITLAVNTTDNYGFINSGLCWLKNPAFYAAFVGPVCFILLINCLAFLLVIKQLVGMSSNGLHKTDKNSTFQRLRGAVGVVILLGLSWIFAIFAIDQASVVFYYLFAIFNSLQGLFIFIFYCLLKKDAIQTLKRHLPCFEEFGDSSKSYTNSRAITAKSGGHKLAEHKGISSTYNGNTNSTNSTSPDSRKDSCFSTISSSNTFDGFQNDRLHDNPEIGIATVMNTTGPPEPQLSNQSINGDLQAYTIPQSEHLISSIDNTKHDLLTINTPRNSSPEEHHSDGDPTIDSHQKATLEEYLVSGSDTIETLQNSTAEENLISGSHALHTHQNSTPEEQSVGDSHTIDAHQNSTTEEKLVSSYEQLSDNSNDSVYSKDNLLPSSSLPAETSSHIQQTLNESSVQLESIESSFPGIAQQTSSSDISPQTSSSDISLQTSISDISQKPISRDISQQPSSLDISQKPISQDISQQPNSLDISQQSRSPDLEQQPSSTDISQQPSSPDISQQLSSPANSSQAMAMLNPSFTPFTAGEIDYSHMASVLESKKKFEWSVSESSESSDINATKI